MIQNIYEAANSCNLFFAILFSCLLIVDLKKPLFITQITLYKLEVIAVLVISFSSFFEIINFIIKKYYVRLILEIFLELVWIIIIGNIFKSIQKEREKEEEEKI